ncbi:hypothetical protein BH23ACT5_BH23ACT5_05600 [soil metagenome]
MTEDGRRWLAVWLGGAAVLLALAPVILVPIGRLLEEDMAFVVLVGLPWALFGAILAYRRPSNPVGWLFAAWGLVMLLAWAGVGYVFRATELVPGSLPGAVWVAWAVNTIWHPAFALLVFILLLFPNGRLPSRRWATVAWATVLVYGVVMVATALSRPVLDLFDIGQPFQLDTSEAFEMVGGVALMVGQVGLLGVAGTSSLFVRYRSADHVERLQVKWFVATVVAVIVTFVAGLFVFGGGVFFPLVAAIPLSATVAILRYRLFEIDRIVSRTVSYTMVVAVLTGVFLGGISLMGSLLPFEGDFPVAASTLLVAALFDPLRRRMQNAVDRRFNRAPFDAKRVTEEFQRSLRDPVDPDEIIHLWVGAVGATLQPATIGVWIPGSGTAQNLR